MIEIQVFIPIADNNGVPFEDADHVAFEAEALRLFGGVTLLEKTAVGLWAEGGTTYHDVMRVYVVGILSITHADHVAGLAEYAKRHYRQKALYIRYLGVSEIL